MAIQQPFKQGADFEYLRKVLMREVSEGPVPIIELVADGDPMSEVTGLPTPFSSMLDMVDFVEGDGSINQDSIKKAVQVYDLSLGFTRAVGYDYVTIIPAVLIPRTKANISPEIPGQVKQRGWQNEHNGLISDRAAFEAFPWPDSSGLGLVGIDYIAPQMPEGAKIMIFYMGIFEDLRALMGFEQMAIKSIREPELIGDILEKLTVIAETELDKIAAHPSVGAVFYAEDMGFNTGTMLSPAFFKEWVIPRQKRIADAVHKHNKPFLLHSCGQVDALMEDLIEVVGIDGYHSFEDNIEPVEDFYKRYHDRISILGGVDVNLLTHGSEEEVRARCRRILDACGPGGGFAIGSGNSITNYCRIENYYTMLDETRRWNEEHGY